MPVDRVDVLVLGAVHRTTTDASGVFHLSPLEPGAVRLGAGAPGFQDASQGVVVEVGRAVEVQIMPIPIGQKAPNHATKTQTAFVGCNVGWRVPGQTKWSVFGACGVAFYAGLTDLDRYGSTKVAVAWTT